MASFAKMSCSRKFSLTINHLYGKSTRIGKQLLEFPQLSSCCRCYVPSQEYLWKGILWEKKRHGQGTLQLQAGRSTASYFGITVGKRATPRTKFFLPSSSFYLQALNVFLEYKCCDVYRISETKHSNFVFYLILC